MNILRQIGVCLLAVVVSLAHPGALWMFGSQPELAVGGNRSVSSAGGNQQVAPQKQQLVFSLAEQRSGTSSVFQTNTKPPAPVVLSHLAGRAGFVLASHLAGPLLYQQCSFAAKGLQVSDIIFPFHSFW